MSEKIYKFDKELLGLNMKPSYEVTKGSKRLTHRLVMGDSELDIKKQSETATPIYYQVNTIKQIETDPVIQNWLEDHPLFGKKISVFDMVAEKEAKLETIYNELDVIDAVRALDDQGALSLGYVLFGKSVLSTDSRVLKHDLIKAAMADTENVAAKMDSKQNEAELFVGLALAADVIKESDSGTKIRWSHNDEEITSVTKGFSPVEEMVGYLKTSAGKIVNSEIHQLVKSKFADQVVDAITAKTGDTSKGKVKTPVTPATPATPAEGTEEGKK